MLKGPGCPLRISGWPGANQKHLKRKPLACRGFGCMARASWRAGRLWRPTLTAARGETLALLLSMHKRCCSSTASGADGAAWHGHIGTSEHPGFAYLGLLRLSWHRLRTRPAGLRVLLFRFLTRRDATSNPEHSASTCPTRDHSRAVCKEGCGRYPRGHNLCCRTWARMWKRCPRLQHDC